MTYLFLANGFEEMEALVPYDCLLRAGVDVKTVSVSGDPNVRGTHGVVVRADMTKRFPFEEGSFDLIFHPVSNCYIRDVHHVWRECARVIRSGGLLMAGLDNGFNYLFDESDETRIIDSLPFDPLSNPEQMESLRKTDSGVQFSHDIGEQIAGQLRAGFELLDVYDDTNGAGFLHEHGVPTFWATLARRK